MWRQKTKNLSVFEKTQRKKKGEGYQEKDIWLVWPSGTGQGMQSEELDTLGNAKYDCQRHPAQFTISQSYQNADIMKTIIYYVNVHFPKRKKNAMSTHRSPNFSMVQHYTRYGTHHTNS